MKRWQKHICLMLACLICFTAGLPATAHAEEACEHEFVKKEVKATCTEGGFAYEQCTKCELTRNHQNTDPLGHEYGEWVVTTAPLCQTEGEETRFCTRNDCDASEKRVAAALGHTYVTTIVEPTCEAEGYTEDKCSRCGTTSKSNPVPALGHDWKETTVGATCTDQGYDLKTCTVCNKKEMSNYVDPLGHDMIVEVIAPTCAEKGYTLHTCKVCGESEKTDYTEALGHKWEDKKVAPTCDEEGYTLHKCMVCGKEEKSDFVAAVGHDWEKEVIAPTCDEEGYTLNICVVCREREKTDFVDPLGHKWGEPEIVDPTCVKEGYTLNICTVCQKAEKTDYVDALGHNWEGTKVAPTCTERGFTQNKCTVCQTQEKVDYVDALGHDIVKEVVAPTCTAKGYTQVTCKRCDHKEKTNPTEKVPHTYDEGVVTKEPTDTAMGKLTYTCTVCGDKKNEDIPKLQNPFEDVSKTAYYYKPVLWAVSEGITSGIDETHFAPNASCTRAQVVTFLWRAAGSPDPKTTECPFKDVSETSYFRKAVLWALENGITSGISSTQFGPDSPCTRAQVVTFLYRAAKSPEWEATERFKDVPRGAYFFTAVSWAADMGITSGVDGEHFGPNQTCTRAQVVTFLYRNAFAEVPEQKPEEKPEETPEAKPEEKPGETPEVKPGETPETKPEG